MIPEYAKTVAETLCRAGFEAYFVGGCVRDLCMGAEPHDWDVATSAVPEEMHRVFAAFRTVDTGIRHGTVTVLSDGVPVEVTTYRVDGSYSDHRHPDRVTFTRSLEDDLSRRDFTVNAMAMSPEGEIVDLFGGQRDLKNGVIRCVGDPDTRFREDSLRILRGMRFASVLRFAVEADTASAMGRCRELMRDVSAERVRAELTKMLCGSGVREVLLRYTEELGVVLPEILPAVGFRQHHFRHMCDVWGHTCEVVRQIRPEPCFRWAALLHDLGKPACLKVGEDGLDHFRGHAQESLRLAKEVTERLRFDSRSRRRILFLVENHDRRVPAEAAAAKRALAKYGYGDLMDLIEVFRADLLGQSPEFHRELANYERLAEMIRALEEQKECVTLRQLQVNGHDLVARGLTGPKVGEGLTMLLDAVIEGKCANERGALLAYLKEKGVL